MTNSDERVNDPVLSNMFGRGMIYSTIFAVQAVSSILVTPAITRSIGAAQFGIVVYVLTVGAVVVGIVGMGTQVGIQGHFADEDGDRETRCLTGMVCTVTLGITLLLVLTVPSWDGLVALQQNRVALQFGLGWAGLFAVVSILCAVLRSQDRLGAVMVLASVQVVASQVCGLLLVFTVTRTANSYFLGMFLGQIIALVLGLYYVKPWPSRVATTHILAVYSLSLPLVPHALSIQVLNLGDRIVVQHFLGSVAVGRYQLAYNTSAILMMILSMLNFAWEPKLFATKDPEIRALMLVGLRDGVFRLLAPSILAIVLAEPLILRILAPSSFHTDTLYGVASVVACSAVPYAWYTANLRRILMFRDTRSIYWVAPICALVNIALNILLVPVAGIIGSAIATFIAYAMLAALVGLRGRVHVRIANIPLATSLPIGIVMALSLLTPLLPNSTCILTVRLVLASLCGVWAAFHLYALVWQPADTFKSLRVIRIRRAP